MPRATPSANKEPLKLPLGLISRARAKSFKEAILALVDQIWGETVVGHIDRPWTSQLGVPCNLLHQNLLNIIF
ncbi:hypothetical protein GOBAR_AA15016 [Gossypium barbadense]|uniref:Uncharacterized protein n=1 Tax=Gossypium barbadense TaxID=3634 RepID=A0A2P5XQM4_GOSBA|nr:hypothetical protein GOBAR_AA15016 [Gossypium barbadense]